MGLRRLFCALGIVASACLLSGVALASDPGMTSVRLGESASDLGGSMRPDAAFAGATTGLPSWLRWALAPQLQIGSTAAGPVDRSYHSLSWTVPVASSVLGQSDALSFGFSFGRGLGLGEATGNLDGMDPRTLRPAPTTRLGAVIGYQVTPDVGLFVAFDHVASGRAPGENDAGNNLGMRLGLRF